ncbi:MAG TPA: HAD family hydrolase [Verrucomicrobiae bacterium]|jgi:FMN phosphatase YigB (HAD superfamily)
MVSLPQFVGTVELRPTFTPRPQISHVVFDFDGTLSWLRHGWPEMMFQVFREVFPARAGESEGAIHDLLINLILSLNGKPTIFQMIRFADLVAERGGARPDPEALRQEYQRRLDVAIAERSGRILVGRATPDDFVVHGSRMLLEKLRHARITPVILSSTVEERVREEAALLGLSRYFGEHIYGGTGDASKFSKMDVFNRLLRSEGITGLHLLSFGDGPVEIANTKELGGLAIAVCSDEHHNGSGMLDPFKQRQLLDAGADAAIPDYRDALALMDYLLAR